MITPETHASVAYVAVAGRHKAGTRAPAGVRAGAKRGALQFVPADRLAAKLVSAGAERTNARRRRPLPAPQDYQRIGATWLNAKLLRRIAGMHPGATFAEYVVVAGSLGEEIETIGVALVGKQVVAMVAPMEPLDEQ